ncbi:MAG: hypothetical protein ACPLRH_02965 [Desulfotomaculales bacterium]
MDKIKRGKEKYVETSIKLGVVPEVAKERAEKWAAAMKRRKRRQRGHNSNT